MIKVVHTISEVRQIGSQWKKEGNTIGFVPTMGYLHEGHQSLIRKSVEENDKTVVSIIVNTMQIGLEEALDSYPRDWDEDKQL